MLKIKIERPAGRTSPEAKTFNCVCGHLVTFYSHCPTHCISCYNPFPYLEQVLLHLHVRIGFHVGTIKNMEHYAETD